jgi:hypothetical protein
MAQLIREERLAMRAALPAELCRRPAYESCFQRVDQEFIFSEQDRALPNYPYGVGRGCGVGRRPSVRGVAA